MARTFGTLGTEYGSDGDTGNEVEVPKDYEYVGTFWEGYWGKRYLHVLPSDKWDYVTFYKVEDRNLYAPFLQPYAAIFISAICGGELPYGNYAKRCKFLISPYESAFVEVKDYSEKRTQHEVRVITLGSGNSSSATNENIFFRQDECTRFRDYVLYKFDQPRSGDYQHTAQNIGQNKLLIQVKENGSESWITMDTRLLVFPPSCGGSGRLSYRVNFYG